MRKHNFLFLALILLLTSIVSAADLIPQGDLIMRQGNQICTNSTNCIGDWSELSVTPNTTTIVLRDGTNSLTAPWNANQNITAPQFLGFLNWSYLFSIPSYVKDWTSDIVVVNTRVTTLNSSKLDIVDQRYNDSSMITIVNNSLVNYMYTTGTNSNITLIKFNLSAPTASFAQGQMGWDLAEDSLSIGYPYGATLQIGKETYKEVTNLDSITLVEGTPVSIVSASGNREAVMRTNISDPVSAYAYIGITTTSIAPNNKGLVTIVGDVHNLNTDNFTEGAPVYVSKTGTLTQTLPTAPDFFINAGTVTVKSATIGIVSVASGIVPRLKDLSDVDGVPVNTSGQFLVWNQTKLTWDASSNIYDYLLLTDQRFNDTIRIDIVNSSLQLQISRINVLNSSLISVNSSLVLQTGRIDLLNSSKLDISDQRFNETERVNILNTSESVLSLYANVQKDPQGFSDSTNIAANTHSTLSFNNANRNFTITPVGANFTYYIKGVLVTKTTPQSLIIANTSGSHIIYFDINGALQETGSLTEAVLCDNVIVAVVVWDAPRNLRYMMNDERHTQFMECSLHEYLHEHLGTQYDSGLVPTNVTTGGSTSANASAQIATTAGAISDEDYTHEIEAYNSPGRFRVYYQLGATGNWSFKQDNFPFIYNGDASGFVGTGGRAAYNLNTGGVWSLTTAGSTNFVLFHVFATNSFNSSTDMIVVEGQNQYTTAALATTGATTEINNIRTNGLFSTEYKPLYTFLIQTNTGYTNAPQSIVQSPSTGGQFIDWRTANLNGASGTTLGGTVTLVDSGLGITGGPITSSGTLSLDQTYIQLFNQSSLTTSKLDRSGVSQYDGTLNVNGTLNANNTITTLGGFSNGGITLVNGNGWFQNLYLAGNFTGTTVAGITVNGSFNPYLDNSVDLGTDSLRYRNLSVYNVKATTGFFGNLNASYVQNSPWLLATDQRYNDTVRMDALNTSITTVNTRVTTLNSTTTTRMDALNTSITTVDTGVTTLNSTKLNLAGGTMTGNLSFAAGTTIKICGGTTIPCYIWYYNTTFFDCLNATGTIYNRGNTSVTCN